MCIRDRGEILFRGQNLLDMAPEDRARAGVFLAFQYPVEICLLYTSDAADERSSVDLGGRRIIKKKKSENAGVLLTLRDSNTICIERHNLRHETISRT